MHKSKVKCVSDSYFNRFDVTRADVCRFERKAKG